MNIDIDNEVRLWKISKEQIWKKEHLYFTGVILSTLVHFIDAQPFSVCNRSFGPPFFLPLTPPHCKMIMLTSKRLIPSVNTFVLVCSSGGQWIRV